MPIGQVIFARALTVVVGTKGENVPRDYPTNVQVPPEESGLPMETVFLGFQILSLDPKRFPANPAGHASDEVMARIEKVVRYCLGL